jgi:hypothetical protein
VQHNRLLSVILYKMKHCKLTMAAIVTAILFTPVTEKAIASGGRMLQLEDTSPNDYDQLAAGSPKPSKTSRRAARVTDLSVLPPLAPASPTPRNQEDLGPGCRIAPVSPSIGADIPEFYFGPAPSTVNPSLVGPLRLLTAGQIDPQAETITLPLYRGVMAGSNENVFYILTDTTDQGNAAALGLNFAPKLNYAATGRGVRRATLMRDGLLVFDAGRVDFSPAHEVRPGGHPPRVPPTVPLPFGETPFPPAAAEPGSVGDFM